MASTARIIFVHQWDHDRLAANTFAIRKCEVVFTFDGVPDLIAEPEGVSNCLRVFNFTAHSNNRCFSETFQPIAGFIQNHLSQEFPNIRADFFNFRREIFDVPAPKPRVLDDR